MTTLHGADAVGRPNRVRPVIPSRSNRRAKTRCNERICRERNPIKRVVGRLKISHAIAARDDEHAPSFLDSLHIAALGRCLRLAAL